jgi:hypothetical protein
MRRLHAWITGAAGGVAAYRLFRRRRDDVDEHVVEVSPEPDPRAEELRAKLAEARVEEADPVAAESPPAPSESPEERRRRVHEQARGALDEMQQPE